MKISKWMPIRQMRHNAQVLWPTRQTPSGAREVVRSGRYKLVKIDKIQRNEPADVQTWMPEQHVCERTTSANIAKRRGGDEGLHKNDFNVVEGEMSSLSQLKLGGISITKLWNGKSYLGARLNPCGQLCIATDPRACTEFPNRVSHAQLLRHSWRARFYPADCIGKGWHLVLQHDVEVVFVKLPWPRDFSCTIDLRPLLAGFLHGPKLWELLAASSLDIRALVSLELVDLIKFGSTESDHLSRPALARKTTPPCRYGGLHSGSCGLSASSLSLTESASFGVAEAPTSSGTSSLNIRGPLFRFYQARINRVGPPLVLLTGRRLFGRLWLARRGSLKLVDLGGLRSVSCCLVSCCLSLSLSWPPLCIVEGVRSSCEIPALTSSGNSSSPHRPRRTTSRSFSSPDNVALLIREVCVLSCAGSESLTADHEGSATNLDWSLCGRLTRDHHLDSVLRQGGRVTSNFRPHMDGTGAGASRVAREACRLDQVRIGPRPPVLLTAYCVHEHYSAGCGSPVDDASSIREVCVLSRVGSMPTRSTDTTKATRKHNQQPKPRRRVTLLLPPPPNIQGDPPKSQPDTPKSIVAPADSKPLDTVQSAPQPTPSSTVQSAPQPAPSSTTLTQPPSPQASTPRTAIKRNHFAWTTTVPPSASSESNKKQITIMEDSEGRQKMAQYETEIFGLKQKIITVRWNVFNTPSSSPGTTQAENRIVQLEVDLKESSKRYDALELRTKDWECPATEPQEGHQTCYEKIKALEEAYNLSDFMHGRVQADLDNRVFELESLESKLQSFASPDLFAEAPTLTSQGSLTPILTQAQSDEGTSSCLSEHKLNLLLILKSAFYTDITLQLIVPQRYGDGVPFTAGGTAGVGVKMSKQDLNTHFDGIPVSPLPIVASQTDLEGASFTLIREQYMKHLTNIDSNVRFTPAAFNGAGEARKIASSDREESTRSIFGIQSGPRDNNVLFGSMASSNSFEVSPLPVVPPKTDLEREQYMEHITNIDSNVPFTPAAFNGAVEARKMASSDRDESTRFIFGFQSGPRDNNVLFGSMASSNSFKVSPLPVVSPKTDLEREQHMEHLTNIDSNVPFTPAAFSGAGEARKIASSDRDESTRSIFGIQSGPRDNNVLFGSMASSNSFKVSPLPVVPPKTDLEREQYTEHITNIDSNVPFTPAAFNGAAEARKMASSDRDESTRSTSGIQSGLRDNNVLFGSMASSNSFKVSPLPVVPPKTDLEREQYMEHITNIDSNIPFTPAAFNGAAQARKMASSDRDESTRSTSGIQSGLRDNNMLFGSMASSNSSKFRRSSEIYTLGEGWTGPTKNSDELQRHIGWIDVLPLS
ncbi:hypothetical protein B0H11DRAFT_1922345 [Mycena galericulata]|nr:hypothetical protein B0H11DRAFT_1922345 [Mycena galericulata]